MGGVPGGSGLSGVVGVLVGVGEDEVDPGGGAAGDGSLAGSPGSDGREMTGRLSTAGMYFRRNLRLRRVTLPDPSTRTTY